MYCNFQWLGVKVEDLELASKPGHVFFENSNWIYKYPNQNRSWKTAFVVLTFSIHQSRNPASTLNY